jgi:hypothetical protein
MLGGALIYFAYVPVTATGLFSILSGQDPITNTIAREESLKLIPALPRYAFTIASVVFGNMLAVFGGQLLYDSWRKDGFWRSIPRIVCGAGMVLAAMLFAATSGARGPAAVTLLGVVAFFVIRSGFHVGMLRILPAILAILAVPAGLQYLRSDDQSIMLTVNTILDRLFAGRIMAGIHTISYAEVHGFFGIGGIPRLATLLGAEPINVPNEVAKAMFSTVVVDSGFANCSFVLSYYSYFGIMALPVCIALINLLDCGLWVVYKMVDPRVQCLAVLGLLVPMQDLTSIDFTLVFVTKGCIPWLLVCIAIGHVLNAHTQDALHSRRIALPILPNG